MKVADLTPGDTFRAPGADRAVFVARAVPHPIWPELALVIWRVYGGDIEWSHDALSLAQDVGEPVSMNPAAREHALRSALLGRHA